MTHTRQLRRWAAAAFATAFLALLPGTLAAQQVGPDGEPTARKPVRRLSGNADQAYSSTRNTGYFNTGCAENVTGAADFDRADPCQTFNQLMNNGFTAAWPRELHWSWGAPNTTWNYAVTQVPLLANAIGAGFTVINSHQTGADDLNAADNSLGPHHAGLTSVNDRSCLDGRPAVGAGFPLLAGSNCPQTWGTAGWEGRRPVPLEVYSARFATLGNNFNFDFWRVSDAELDAAGVAGPTATSPGKIIGNYQTYGYTSDYTTDILCGTTTQRNYGHLFPAARCPGADAARRRPGWPLGIELRFDQFSFQLPTLNNIIYYQVTFVNKSRDLYGVPLDYDSLYISLQNGWFGGAIQQNPTSWVPEWGALVTTSIPVQGPCTAAKLVSDFGCAAWGTNFGFTRGAAALIVLKSPIGDQRNKLFSRPGPFFNPAHPLAGDTFTVMHGHLCGFRACGANTFASPATNPDHEQRSFGMMSSTEVNAVGTRIIGQITDQIYWHTFRPRFFPTMRYTPGDAASVGGGFSRWAPSMAGINWDWGGPPGSMNPKDGVQDTLAIDGCWINGCSALFGDTLPNGKYSAYSNTHGTAGVGPIRLMADSVVSFVFAITTAQANDSAGFVNNIKAAIDNYMAFYLAPDAAPKCRMTGVTRLSPGEGETVGISWDNRCFPGQWTDAFLNKQYNDLLAAPPGSALSRLRQLNPRLDDTLNFLRNNNLKRLYVYKSCNDGGVWTTADDCITGSPATGGDLATLGWLPYATFDADGTNPIPNAFTDLNVRGGQTYTYNVIGETRGAKFLVINGDSVVPGGAGDTLCARNCRVDTLALAPVLFNSLSASTGEVNVARAYLPVSLPAGGARSRTNVTDSAGPMTSRRLGVSTMNDSLAAADYRVLFGDSASATRVDRYNRATKALTSVATNVVLKAAAGSTTVVGTNTGGFTPSGGTSVVAVTLDTVGVLDDSLVTTTYTWATGPVMAVTRYPTGTPVDALLVSSTLTGASATPGSFHSNPDYPRFDLSINSALANAFDQSAWFEANLTPVAPLIVPTVDWMNTLSLQNNAAAGGNNQANGDYSVTWSAHAFGSGGQAGSDLFILDFAVPNNSVTQIQSSLNARAVGSTGVVTPAAATAIQAATGVTTTIDSLVAVRVPFVVFNRSYNRPVQVAMRVRPAAGKSIVVGAAADTIRVPVQADVWVPGDTLYFLEQQGIGGTGALSMTFQRAVVGCDATRFTRLSCNPVYPGTRGSSVYLSPDAQQINGVAYHTPITPLSQFTLTALAPSRGAPLQGDQDAIRAGLASVRAVPNPYIMLSQYTTGAGTTPSGVLMFTHMPPSGVLRIYTVSGQFVQQITWDEDDLQGTGDLQWNMRTREGNLIGAGLYIYVLTATDANGATIGTRTDKFVVIR